MQFGVPLAEADLRILSEFLSAYPNVKLRAYGYRTVGDLEFLRYFPFVKRFQVDCYELDDLSGLRYLPSDLEYLGLGRAKSKRHSLRMLENFPELKTLSVEGHTKDFASVGKLTKLEHLRLGATLPANRCAARGV